MSAAESVLDTSVETIEKIALSMTPGVNSEVVRRMEECGMTPHEFLTTDMTELSATLGLKGRKTFSLISRDEAFIRARKEVKELRRYAATTRVLFMLDDAYPSWLRETHDAPVVLYFSDSGKCDLNPRRAISVVGTRRCTAYGISFVRKLIADLAAYFPDLLVVSGMAYGIDIAAHTAAIEAGLPTVGVMAHGISEIYPREHTDMARRMAVNGGGILTEYPLGTKIYGSRFLERNRIVAGMTPVTIVAESEVKGGAMSTARRANDYDRQVMALPGRISDPASGGCNMLLRRQQASVVTCAADVMELMDWQPDGLNVDMSRRNLFPELSGDSKTIYDCMRNEKEAVTVDSLHYKTHIPVHRLMELLSDLEFDGVVARGAGNRYILV